MYLDTKGNPIDFAHYKAGIDVLKKMQIKMHSTGLGAEEMAILSVAIKHKGLVKKDY